MMTQLKQHYDFVFLAAPLLELFLFLALGAFYYFQPSWASFLLFLFFLYLSLHNNDYFLKKILFAKGTFLFFLGISWTSIHKPLTCYDSKLTGSGLFKIHEKKPTELFGQQFMSYKGNFLFFDTPKNSYIQLKCSFITKDSSFFDLPNLCYFEQIDLVQKRETFRLKFGKNSLFVPLSRFPSLGLMRASLKQKTKHILQHYYKDEIVLKTLIGLTTAEVESKLLKFHFAQTGLLHLLAVSGFHFGLISAFFSRLLSPFLRKKKLFFALILVLTLYMLYLGHSPSIARAYIAAVIYLLGKILGYEACGLNCLGLGALLSFLHDPFVMKQCSFQLSYLATLCLLYVFPILMHSLEKKVFHFKLLKLLTKAVVMNLSVTLLSFPSLFLHFGSFPWISFLFNLFIPFCFSCSMLLLLIGLLLEPFHLLAHILHLTNAFFTEKILKVIFEIPSFLCKDITCSFLTPLSCMLLSISIWMIFALSFRVCSNDLL